MGVRVGHLRYAKTVPTRTPTPARFSIQEKHSLNGDCNGNCIGDGSGETLLPLRAFQLGDRSGETLPLREFQ